MLKYLLEKEFKQFIRNPVMPRMVLIMPLVMMIVFPLATNRQVQDITISIVDNDKSQYSMELVNKITSSGYFILADYSSNYSTALKSVEKGDAYIILEIEKDFEKNIVKEGSANVIISANAVDMFKGSMGAIFSVPTITYNSCEQLMCDLKNNGFSIYLADTRADKDYFNYKYDKKVALVMGSERYGISSPWLGDKPNFIKLKMLGQCDSLNVGVATSIFLYDIKMKQLGE